MGKPDKPLGGRGYGHIGHIPGSKLGPGDHTIEPNQAALLTGGKKLPTRHHCVVIQEKLDGSCLAVAKIEGRIVTIGRAGYLNSTAPFPHLLAFDTWVDERRPAFDALLLEGERVIGEWVAFAMSTLYRLPHDGAKWRPFDIMRGHDRVSSSDVFARCANEGFLPVTTIAREPMDPSSAYALAAAAPVDSRGVDGVPEGVVYRMEERGRTLFMGKWVRADYEPGALFETIPSQAVGRA